MGVAAGRMVHVDEVAPACRFCRAPLRHVFADLGMSPVANDNVPLSESNAMEPFFPLCALVCAECFLVQLAPFETPRPIFRPSANKRYIRGFRRVEKPLGSSGFGKMEKVRR